MKMHVAGRSRGDFARRAAHGATTVVTADRMLDVTTGRYVEHPAIFIGDNGRITSVADARTVRFAGRVKHIDLPGETLLPGLIDMHVHLTSLAEIGGYQGLKYHRQFLDRGRRRQCARRRSNAGFTTVRNVGSSDFDDVALEAGDRRRLDRGPAHRARRPMRSARPAAIATTPACRLITTRRRRR